MIMEQSKIERINFLAKKQKGEGLTPEEKEEQAILRREYIDSLKSIPMTIKADLSCRLWAYEP